MKLVYVLLFIFIFLFIFGFSFYFGKDIDVSLSDLSQSTLNPDSNQVTIIGQSGISQYKSNPEIKQFNVTLDNGLKITYRNYAVTYRPQFILENGNVLSWQDITNDFPTIEKYVWINQVSGNKKEWGVNFNNLTLGQTNAIDSIRLHLTNATKQVWNNETNLTETLPMTWSDVSNHIEKKDGQLKIAGKINLNKDFFNHLTITGLNRTDITISGFDNEWEVCDEFNWTTDECIISHNESHWKYNPSINTYNISIY